jgi:ATP phosphoribosyltransferase
MSDMRDLGLSYEEAAHGVQSAVKYEMEQRQRAVGDELKHLRVGLDMRAADMRGLVELLITKGAITGEDYIEQMRLAANEELARYEDHVRRTYGLPPNMSFR